MTSSVEPELATLRGHKDTGETKTDNEKSFTTLSTIAIQAGQSQLVVSVVKSGSLVHLELIQVQPDLCEIGSNEEENRTLMQEHEKLMKTMKKHQQEVVEAPGEIGRKRRQENQEVYQAMGACLNDGWYNLLRVLERRQEVLTLAAKFYQAASQLLLRVDNVEEALLRVDVGSADATLALDAMRRDVLRSSLKVLLSGGELLRELELLQRTDNLRGASVNSRPSQQVVVRVEFLLEFLQDRRRTMEEVLGQRLSPQEHDITGSSDIRPDSGFNVEQSGMQRNLLTLECESSRDSKPGFSPDPNIEYRFNMRLPSQSDIKYKAEARGANPYPKPEIQSNTESKSVLNLESCDPNTKSRSHQKLASTLDETKNHIPDLYRSVVSPKSEPGDVRDQKQVLEPKVSSLIQRHQKVLEKDSLTFISGRMPDLPKCLVNSGEQNNMHSDAHRTLPTNHNQSLLLMCQQLLDKVSKWVEQSSLFLSKHREIGPQLWEAEDLLDQHLLSCTHAESAGQILQRLKVSCTGSQNIIELEAPNGRISHLSRLKSLTEQLKCGDRTRKVTELQLAARVSAVLDEMKTLNKIVECNVRVLQGYVSFLKAAQQLEEDIKIHRCTLQSKKEGEDIIIKAGTSWLETMQRVVTIQKEASEFISNIAKASTSGFNLQSVVTAVQQLSERLSKSQKEVADLHSELEINNRQEEEDTKSCRKYQERLCEAVRDLKEVLKLLDSCTQVDLGFHEQTLRLQQQFGLAKPYFARLDKQNQILLKNWDAMTPVQNRLLQEVSELRVLRVKVNEKIQKSQHILDLSNNFHLVVKQLEMLLQLDPAGLLRTALSTYEETCQQIHQLLTKAFWVKKEIGELISDNVLTKFRGEQLDVGAASLYTQSALWLSKVSSSDHALMRDVQQSDKEDTNKEEKSQMDNLNIQDMSELKETGRTPELTVEQDEKEVTCLTDTNMKLSSPKMDNSQSRSQSGGKKKYGASSHCSTHTFRMSCSPVEVGRKVYVIHRQLNATSTLSASVHEEPASVPLVTELQQQDVVSESFLSSDEYECGSFDDISLPSLAETPECIIFQDDVEEHCCLSSHSTQNKSNNQKECKNQPERQETGLATGEAQQHKESTETDIYFSALAGLHSDTREILMSSHLSLDPCQPINAENEKTCRATIQQSALEKSSSSHSHHFSQNKPDQRSPKSEAQLIQTIFPKADLSGQTPSLCPTTSESSDIDLYENMTPQECKEIAQSSRTFPQNPCGAPLRDSFEAEKEKTTVMSPDSSSKWITVKNSIYNLKSSTRSIFTSSKDDAVPQIDSDPRNFLQNDTILSFATSPQSFKTMTNVVQSQMLVSCSSSECERLFSREGPEVFEATRPPDSQDSGSTSSKQCVDAYGMTPRSSTPPAVADLTRVLTPKASLHATPQSHELTLKEEKEFCEPVAIREEIKITPQIVGPPLPAPTHSQTEIEPLQQASAPSPLHLSIPLSRAAVMGGVPVNLELAVTEHPEPKVTWFKDGRKSVADHKKDGKEVEDRWLLVAVVDIISGEMTSCFGTFCILLWLLLLLLLLL
ncbi:coiled-coil domain-containing protein 141 isoform X3 [Nerophis ophidion]|uniref:coiled-coil domain-containing protein 141 isoform X3 n=1 Tax=Nerophis ophidion TaxID=159077 RepID=UPI002ADFF7CA|nr:coiled-coil domain-containing protein 141 isoform X3 [Nerophis ophidion]